MQNLETFRRKVYKGFLSSFLCFYKKDGKVPDRERHWRLCRHNSREAANTVAAATGKGCRQGRRKSTRSVPSRQGQTFRRKVTKAARPPKKRPQGGKGFNWVSAKSLLGCAASRFGKPRSSLWEGFNFVCAKPQLRRAESRFAEPRCSLQRERIVTFCIVQKVTKKHTGLRPATSIQSSAGNNLREASCGTSRNRFFAQNGGEKALNRCEVPALQRKDLERK